MAAVNPDRQPNTRSVAHPGPCGSRHDPPCGSPTTMPILAAETLRNGDTCCHLCGIRWRPWELPMAQAGICGERRIAA